MRGEEVKICLVLQPGIDARSLTPEAVLEFCAVRLARFKLPRYIAYLQALPKTPSGKIAKQALQPPGADLRLGAYDAIEQLWR
jgi:acyl-CoA synthetase (AMP-forming)/AMP-acid ligase II